MEKDTILKILPENNRMKEYLKNLDSKAWSMNEFDKECAYWFISCKGLEPLSLPTRPSELKEYDKLSFKDRTNISFNFWRQRVVSDYLDQKQSIIDRNRGILQTLKEYKEYIPIEDTITRAKYDSFIAMYYAPEEVTDLAQDFNGEIVERGFKN